MKKIIILFSLIMLSCNIKAEINVVVDNFPIKHFKKTRNVSATFEFISIPTPLKITTINYKITNINGSATPGVVQDRIIRIGCVDSNVKLISNDKEIWAGVHNKDDVYEGVIQCIPLSSGYYGIDVNLDNNPNSSFSIRWFLDENGKLIYLNNPEVDPPKLSEYNFLDVKFFNSDSVYIKSDSKFANYKFSGSNNTVFPFQYEINIKPIPKIDDTSTVHIRLKANTEISNGMLIEFNSSYLNIVSYPDKIDYPIINNQIIDLSFQIVPQAINEIESFDILLLDDENTTTPNYQRISTCFLFNNDKTLRYINDGVFNSRKQNILPTIFSTPYMPSSKRVYILKDGNIILK